MVEIYNYRQTVYDNAARLQQALEDFRKQYHLPPGGAKGITLHTTIQYLIPTPTAIDLLTNFRRTKTWAKIQVPPNFYVQVGPHKPFILAPEEQQEADKAKLAAYSNTQSDPIKKRQHKVLDNLLEDIKKTNIINREITEGRLRFIQA
jgi:hypothetical protein